jgi:dienelactone hydrolase
LLDATLYIPSGTAPVPAVVILSTSAGIQPYRESYYANALVNAGIAALVVDSFGPRGIATAVEDQGLLTSYQMEADAFGALSFLRNDQRILPNAVAVMGVSKGGTAALNSSFLIRETWRNTTTRFAAHVAISPDCTTPHRSVATTGAPILLVLAELDDYADPAPCRAYAAQINGLAGAHITTYEVPGAHHGWERLGSLQVLPNAENFSACRGIMEDSGRLTVAGEMEPLTSAEYLVWARDNCVSRGAHAGGGNAALRDGVTADILAFLRAMQ